MVKRILLADDSITIQKVVELTFSEGDYQVVCVGNGAQALRKVQEVRPNLVLLDVIMPEKNGYEVCEQIKRNPATAGIPVLLLTGTFEPFDKKRADQVGADGHLTKPFESQVLVARVEELIAATPTLASDEAGGVMDIVSGGEVYHIDPGAEAAMRLTSNRPAAPLPPPVSPPAPEPRAAAPVPSGPSAGPDPGGGYVGFADVGFTQDRSDMLPEQMDQAAEVAGATVRLRRDTILPGAPPGTTHGVPGPGSGTAEETFGGAEESQFDMVDDAAASPIVPAAEPAAEWSPPPEAPPAETWTADEEPVRPVATASVAAAPMALSPEAIELIAEKVVQRISDRVVREIAWEVIPQVAEAVVRDRIRELEEKPTD